MGEIWYNS